MVVIVSVAIVVIFAVDGGVRHPTRHETMKLLLVSAPSWRTDGRLLLPAGIPLPPPPSWRSDGRFPLPAGIPLPPSLS